ncbi:TPA: 4Fe-4S binding protein [Candidatus Bathyarchaeota archaeon]|nr:4Fe-4S binding protein [Candidatus Bathyarchaeota archaeon]
MTRMRPPWFITLLKTGFPLRFAFAKASRIPGIGAIMSWMLFDGDDMVYLPKDNVVELAVNQPIDPGTSTPLPGEVVHRFIDEAGFHWAMNFCICREANKCKDYPRDLGCLFLGEAAKRIDPKLGHPITREEAHEHIRRADEAGLIHVIGRNKLDAVWLDIAPGERLLTVCNCCSCCCLWKMLPSLNGAISGRITKMDGIEVTVDPSACVGCGACQKVCFVDAIKIEDGKARITDQCRGCGRCVEACHNNAIKMTTPTTEAIENTVKRIREKVDVG